MTSQYSLAMATALTALAATTQAQEAAPPPDTALAGKGVPVRKVMLFNSGVGYFEHFGPVSGDATTELRFKTDQMKDILKSLVLQDMDGGTIGSVTYPSEMPLSETLRSFQVDISNNPSLAALLEKLRGASVTVLVNAEKVSGVVLGVERRTRQLPEGQGTVEEPILNLLSGAVVRPVELSSVRSVELQDPKLQEELSKALAAMAGARDQDKKPVTIHFRGQGDRRVRFGYVVGAPVWKTSYRLVLPALNDKEASAQIQGWAIVENQTDSDWDDVQMTLVSGRPISFVQDLYSSLYISRPVVKPELYQSLLPQTYSGGLGEAKAAGMFGAAGAPAPMAAPPGGRARRQARGQADADGVMAESFAKSMEALAEPLDATASVASVASATQVGELFQYTVGNVRLARQQSAMLPIVAGAVEAERLSIYNANVLAKHPLNGARLKNTTGNHLLAGPITVLDGGSYAGDASVESLPPGQERLISFGIDLQVRVNADGKRSANQSQTLVGGKVVKGVLQLKRKTRFSQAYLIDNQSDRDKTVMVEHPVRPGFELVDTVKPVETTEQLHRFKSPVAAGKAVELVVVQERTDEEVVRLHRPGIGADGVAEQELQQLLAYAGQGGMPAKVAQVLQEAARLWQAVTESERAITETHAQVAKITDEQGRIRSNMGSVDRASEYYTRLLAKLNEQETQIERLQKQLETLNAQRDQQRKAVEKYLNELSVE